MRTTCAICDGPLLTEDAHTDPDTGEDVHAECCPLCAAEVSA